MLIKEDWCTCTFMYIRNLCCIKYFLPRALSLITSSERRSIKSISSESIIFRKRWAIVLLMTHIWKLKDYFCQKGENVMNSQKVTFEKSQTETARLEPPRKAAYSEHSIAIHSISKAGYVTAVYRTELRVREASSFCDFWKLTSCNFTLFYHFLTQANVFFLDVLGKEYHS